MGLGSSRFQGSSVGDRQQGDPVQSQGTSREPLDDPEPKGPKEVWKRLVQEGVGPGGVSSSGGVGSPGGPERWRDPTDLDHRSHSVQTPFLLPNVLLSRHL